jgi:hypothetical protein
VSTHALPVARPTDRIGAILDAWRGDFPNVTVGVRCDGALFRACLPGIFVDGKEIVTPCRDTPDAAIETLYEMIVERAWKDFRPAQLRLKRLGFEVPEPFHAPLPIGGAK